MRAIDGAKSDMILAITHFLGAVMKTEILITSPPDRERTVAEIWGDDDQLAEINDESGYVRVEIYPRLDGKPWLLPYDDLLQLLEQAKISLVGNDPP